jgi:UDP:flavonoid glycosyltransferase YjiC (YdhE family)
MFTSIAPAAALTDLLPLARRLRPDLVVHEEAEFAGPVVAEVLGVPWVTHSWAAPAVPAATRDATAQRLELLWREHLATAPRCSGDLYLDACPPLLQVAEAGTIPGGTVAEFCHADRLVEVASSVAGEVASVLVTSGPCSADELRVALPPHVVVRRYVPLRDALPKVDLVVSHGGAGTTVAALASGLPHLVLPQGAPSQSRNGAAVAAAGAGLMLDGAAQTSSAVRRASAQLLEEPRFAAAAAAAGTTLGALPAPDDVVDLLVARYA